jgi:septum formation protein
LVLVLASSSPRRAELLRNAGFSFAVQPADIDERLGEQEAAQNYVERLAREKALAVFQTRPGDYVLGADTTVVVDGEILVKPQDGEDAARMLRSLSGRVHQVITGVCLASPGADGNRGTYQLETGSETTLVTMTELSEEEIRQYVATGDPLDKAGAYGIQGIASRWILRIEGDYYNVVGLPVALVYKWLRNTTVDQFDPGQKVAK